MSIRLYVGNLPEDLTRQELEAVFAEEGDGVSAKLITDRKTGKCRGFGFVTVKTDELADQLIEKFNGLQVKDNAIKIEKALPRTKETEDQPEGSAPAPVSAPSSGGARRKGGTNNANTKTRSTTTTASANPDSIQPDPRWAQDLEKLKQLLATQTTNS
ncbi:MAG: RNA-binding protein [Candidatus Parcubacteria bacterium]|uniref:RNA recognition motif domain-containing protein n=1 Tax=Phormidesmis priestleyi TaxID=268141 RepID=UPI00083B6356|nr:RNA-binding protein [Phormidesmis priestleyi]MBC7822458.1 RNA-binding protein [Leptolyngbyaceae cyanobacterium LF-bin-113]